MSFVSFGKKRARRRAGIAAAGIALAMGAGGMQAVSAAPAPSDLAALQQQVAQLKAEADRNEDRAEIANLWGTYQYLHMAYQDKDIIPLWVKKGTPGIHAQYSNNGVYNTWESVTVYHRDRPHPIGKLVVHAATTPVIEVAADGQTAKGLWIVTGVESGLTDPEVAKNAPPYMYEKELVRGKKVWAHNVQVKYGLDFLKQDGKWKIWHLHCYEVSRSPAGSNWIAFAGQAEDQTFSNDLMYFGDDGKPVFMPKPDAKATMLNNPYRTDTAQSLDAPPPVPYRTFSETFSY